MESEQGEVSRGQMIEELKNSSRVHIFLKDSKKTGWEWHGLICSIPGLSYYFCEYSPREFVSK